MKSFKSCLIIMVIIMIINCILFLTLEGEKIAGIWK